MRETKRKYSLLKIRRERERERERERGKQGEKRNHDGGKKRLEK